MPFDLEKKRIEESQLLDLLKSRFNSTLQHDSWEQWRQNAKKAYDYWANEQWTDAEKKILAERGQPPTVNNQIKLLVDYVMGQYLQQRTRTAYRGRNTPADDQSHHTLTALKLFIEQNNQFEFQEKDMVRDGTITGFGCLNIRPFFNEETGMIEVKIEHVDVFEMYIDPFSRKYDWNEDAKFISRERWVELGEAKKKWPDKAADLERSVNSSADGGVVSIYYSDRDEWNRDTVQWVDSKRKRIRIIEQWYKKHERVVFMQLDDGRSGEVTGISRGMIKRLRKERPEIQILEEIKEILHVTHFTSDLILETKRDPHRGITMYPFVPYYVERQKNGEPFSFVKIVTPMQDAVNKRESKAVHLLNVNQTITEKNNIEDLNKYAEERARPDGIAVVKDLKKLITEKNVDLAITQMNFHQAGIRSIRQISGINPDALGEAGSPIRSGIGVARKQQGTAIIVSPQFDELRRTRIIEAKLILQYVRKYYTGSMVFRITDDPKMGEFASQTFFVNMRDVRTGQVTNTSTRYAYDIVAEDIPSAASLHQNQFQTLAQVLPALSQMHPAYAMILVQASDLKDKDKIIRLLMAAMQSPPPTKPPNTSLSIKWDDLSDADKNAFRENMGVRPQQTSPGQELLQGVSQ